MGTHAFVCVSCYVTVTSRHGMHGYAFFYRFVGLTYSPTHPPTQPHLPTITSSLLSSRPVRFAIRSWSPSSFSSTTGRCAFFFNCLAVFLFFWWSAIFRNGLGQLSQRLCPREPTEREQTGCRSFCGQRMLVVLSRVGICNKNRSPRWTRENIIPAYVYTSHMVLVTYVPPFYCRISAWLTCALV